MAIEVHSDSSLESGTLSAEERHTLAADHHEETIIFVLRMVVR